jgi:hypothetical protein
VAAAFKHAEWTFHDEVDEYDLEWQEESIEEMLDNRLKLHVAEVVDNCHTFLQNLHGHEYDQKSRLKVFFGVGEDSLTIMRKWVSKEANKRKLKAVTETEFFQWVALNIATDLINLPLRKCLSMITLLQNTRNFPAITTIIQLDRYKELTQCVRAINPDYATNTRHSWGGVIDNVANMREFESAVFGPSRKICMTPNAIIVVDDELVSCRSKTVQSRIISQRKRGKDGLKNDSIACSITRIVLGVRHKQRIQGTTGDLDDTQGIQNDPESSQLTQVELHRAVETLKRQRGSILAQCNKGIHKRMRLSKNVSHNWRALGKKTVKTVQDGQETVTSYQIQKVCVVCGGVATNECTICKVPLHTTRLNGSKAASPCFSRWHNNQRIDLNP